MKRSNNIWGILLTGIGALTTVLVVHGAHAEIRNFAFSGTVNYLNNRQFYLNSSVTMGAPITGFYIYDTATADSNADSTVGDYRHTNSTYGIVVKIGDYIFRSNPEHVDFLVEVVNRSTGDNYLLRSYNNVCSHPLMVDHISWQLDDPSGLALSSATLPTVPPNLEAYQSPFGLDVSGAASIFLIRGTITSIQENAAVIPQRPQASTEHALEVKWQTQMGYFYQVQSSTDMKAWVNVGQPVLGDGGMISKFFPREQGRHVFYRAEIKNFDSSTAATLK